MKLLLLALPLLMLTASKESCKKKKANALANCYKGRLEVKGGCMNYTISLTGKFDPALVNANWKDETTGKEYKNVFALGSRCNFPAAINEGDEFYFMIDSTAVQNCAVCMMYYPKPPKQLSIRVLDGPCTP